MLQQSLAEDDDEEVVDSGGGGDNDPTAATCEACMQAHLTLLTSSTCNCVPSSDFGPYCNSTTYTCDARSDKCVPTPGGEYPTDGDCLADGCGQPRPPVPPPGPPPGPIPGHLWLPPIFADDMVLQAEASSIHGHAMPGATVTLAATPARAGIPTEVVAGADGVWNASFGSQLANMALTNLTIRSGAGIVTFSRVLFGDVILCSGQSNMGIPTSYILNSTAVIAAAEKLGKSVRLLRVASGDGQATTPQTDVTLQLEWTRATPATVAAFSAVCWTFALNLAYLRPDEFAEEGRPLGLVMSEAGGTPIEAWMSAESAAKCPDVPRNASCTNTGNITSGLFNEQIAPFRSMSFKLAIWYQGESNALWSQYPADGHTDSTYTCRYAQLVAGYRSVLNFVGRKGWLTVQIAPFLGVHTKSVFPSIRYSQQVVGDATPGVATVVTHDLGDPLSPPPAGSMHPRDKFVLGARLASAALELVARCGPATFMVQLDRAAGLHMVGSRGCANVTMFDDGTYRNASERCCSASDTFQLWPSIDATQQQTPWTAASGPTAIECTVMRNSITALKCTASAPIVGAQVWTFAWQNFPPCMLANSVGLPASPMRAAVPTTSPSACAE
eukprot:gene264-8704_t